MRILNFTEPAIKPSLQDRSKCFTIRKAWDWKKVGGTAIHNFRVWESKREWVERQKCRHKVGALETIMWNQRGKNRLCCNCVNESLAPDSPCAICDGNLFSKVFGVGKILQTQKVWMYFDDERGNGDGLCILDEGKKNYLDITTILHEDGFKNIIKGELFFAETYPIITREWMPFWRIGWEWQK